MSPHERARVYRDGRRRLRDWLPATRAEAARLTYKFTAVSAISDGMMPHIREDRLDALVIYPAPLGGWHADLVFKGMPPGVPCSMGTPVQQPVATRHDAEEAARVILGMALTCAMGAAEAPTAKPAPASFLLYGWSVELRPALLEAALSSAPKGYYDVEDAADLACIGLERILSDLCPAGFDGAVFDKWADRDRAKLVAALHMAALSGVYRYPLMPHRPAPP